MRVLYVAKHGQHDNMDEGAIAHAFRELGHTVIQVQEFLEGATTHIEADFCLFHKWNGFKEMEELAKRMPVACWFFDKVEFPGDSMLQPRSEMRLLWLINIFPHCSRIFLTDGDYVDKDTTGKLRWLMQGADERYIGVGEKQEKLHLAPILFFGMSCHGDQRTSHVKHLKERWGDQFQIFGDTRISKRIHGRLLASYMASTKIIIAPDGPSTDRYWSNRVFLTLGFQGFLLHPYCKDLEHFYKYEELIRYHDRNQLDDRISEFLSSTILIEEWKERGFKATKERNLYRHRVEKLLEEMKGVING